MPTALSMVDTVPPLERTHCTSDVIEPSPLQGLDGTASLEDTPPLKEASSQSQTLNDTPHLSRLVHLRQNHEITLLWAGETARLIAIVTNTLAQLSGRSVNLSTPRWITLFAKLTSRLSPKMEALVAMLDEWQILWRLCNSLDTWIALKELWREMNWKQSLSARIDIVLEASQILSMGCYYVFEAIAWLGYQRLMRVPSDDQAKFYRWSSWGWVGGVTFDNIRAIVEWRRKERAGTFDDECKAQFRKVFRRNLAWAFVAANLGVKGGFMPDMLAAALGVYASGSEIKDAWVTT